MEIIGIVAEYSPFHNGHLYQINKIKELYPDSIIVLILNGYFLERGLISIESKEEKTRLAIKYGIDIVLELPIVFGTNSADIFADTSVKILNYLGVKKLIFGSESNDIKTLVDAANYQFSIEFKNKLKSELDKGINYPTALNNASIYKIKEPNDLLGLSYIKSIINNKFDIEPISIKRNNSYHDITSNDQIISASNIREKINNNIDISKYIPEGKIENIDYNVFFQLLKYKIITSKDLSIYLTVDEGIDNKLKKVINNVNNLDELINNIKTKRYTYNRLMRMFIHILIGLTKEDKNNLNDFEYIKVLGFTKSGQLYLNNIKKDLKIPVTTSLKNINSIIKEYELKAASIYELITKNDAKTFELSNKPIREE